MQRFLPRLIILISCVFFMAATAAAQDTTHPTSVDPNLLALQNARIPKEYTIGSIKVTGISHLDTSIVLSVSGLQVGDKITIPGSDAFAKAVTNLWRQKLFSNIQIFITDVNAD